MPTRYIFAANHTIAIKDTYSRTREIMISHVDMPNGIRAIITIGDVNGIIDITVARVELGSDTTVSDRIRPIIIGKITID